MFSLITQLSLSEGSARFCYSVSGNANKCPSDTISITPETFSTWTTKMPEGSKSVEYYIVDSLGKDKIINPSDVKSYISKFSIIGQVNGQIAYLNTTKNPFVEELEVKNIELVITTDTISYDSVTLKDVKLTSMNSKTIHTTARSIAGDLASIAAINKGIDASQGSFLVGDLKIKEDTDLWFHADTNIEYDFSNINKNLNITFLPNVIEMNVEGGNHLRLHILSRLPKFTMKHTVSGVSVTFNEIGNVGTRLINCFNIILGNGSILSYPDSVDILGTSSIISPEQGATPIIRQGGRTLPLSIRHSSGLEYEVKGTSVIPVIDADKATLSYKGSAKRNVKISKFIPGEQFTADGINMSVDIGTVTPEKEFKMDGSGSYHINTLTATKAVSISNLIVSNDTEIIVDASKSAKVTVDKITFEEAGDVNILVDDSLAEGTYTVLSAPSIDCSKFNLKLNGNSAKNIYELRNLNAKAVCVSNVVNVELSKRVEQDMGSTFCIAPSGCPEDQIAIPNEENFKSWLVRLPKAAKKVNINIYADILEPGTPLVFDFKDRNALDVTIESKGGLKQCPPSIDGASLFGAIERLHLIGAEFDVNGLSEKLKLPYLELSSTARLTSKFHNNLDSTCQVEYTVSASADSDFTNFNPKTLNVDIAAKDCTVRFRDGLWQLSTPEFSYDIVSTSQKLSLRGATNWVLIGDGSKLGAASIDASSDGATVKVEGIWPKEFNKIELVNGHNAVYSVLSDTLPFSISTSLPPSFFELYSPKGLSLPSLEVRSNAIFSSNTSIGELSMEVGSGVSATNSGFVNVQNLTIAGAADIRIPAEVIADRLSVGLGASVVLEQIVSYPKRIELDYALPLAPFVTVVGSPANNGETTVALRYVESENGATRDRRVSLKNSPYDVVCGSNLNCSKWSFEVDGPVTASCYTHETRGISCVRLSVVQLGEPLNAKEITIIVVFTVAVVAGILACVICCRRKKEDMYKTVDAGQQLLD